MEGISVSRIFVLILLMETLWIVYFQIGSSTINVKEILKVDTEKMFSKQDYQYFRKANQIANISDFPKVHIGCVAVYQGNIIGVGCNSNKTHPIQDYYNRYRLHNQSSVFSAKLHAEISCLLSIKDMNLNFSKVKLYIFRNMKDKSFGMCRPCPSCMAMIKDLGIRHIYYTSDTGFIYEKVGE